jgi:nucleotide-binding universal stress UspA family protein
MFKRILVPVDLTAKNKRALETAIRIALQNRGRVTLLHVIENVAQIPFNELKEFYDELAERALRKMRTLRRSLETRKIPVKQMILIGNRTDRIVRYASEQRIDLIILSSHKINMKKKGSDWGTISYKVAILARCPVLLVK